MNQYKLGEFLMNRYRKFLGGYYSPESIKVQSTDTDRTKMSAEFQKLGLYTNNKYQKLREHWLSESIHYDMLSQEKVRSVFSH